jgi:hypothetical protein
MKQHHHHHCLPFSADEYGLIGVARHHLSVGAGRYLVHVGTGPGLVDVAVLFDQLGSVEMGQHLEWVHLEGKEEGREMTQADHC